MAKLKPGIAAAETLQTVATQLDNQEGIMRSMGAVDGGHQRAAVATKLWTLILQSNPKQQEELLKQFPPARLLALLEGSPRDPQTAYAAAGCLSVLIQHPRWLAELTTGAASNRLVSACGVLLSGPHDRSRLPAVQLLQALAACPMQVPRLAPVLPTLLSLLAAAGGPGWAGGRQLSCRAAGVLAALLAPSECEPEAQQQARRCACLSAGAVRSLLELLGGDSGGAVLLPAAACLRFLALAPRAADIMAGDPEVACQLLQLLKSSVASKTPGVCAFISGVLWELAAVAAAAEKLMAAGAVEALLHAVQVAAAAVLGGGSSRKTKKKKGGKKGSKDPKSSKSPAAGASEGGKKGRGKDGQAAAAWAVAQGSKGEAGQPAGLVLVQDPQAATEVALCNTAGALHHLSFLDAAKLELGASPHLALLVQLANTTQGQTFDNLVGTLCNVGLLDINQPLLAAAGAPRHLARPLPAR